MRLEWSQASALSPRLPDPCPRLPYPWLLLSDLRRCRHHAVVSKYTVKSISIVNSKSLYFHTYLGRLEPLSVTSSLLILLPSMSSLLLILHVVVVVKGCSELLMVTVTRSRLMLYSHDRGDHWRVTQLVNFTTTSMVVENKNKISNICIL